MPKIDTEKLEAYAQMIFERENQFNTYTLKTIARRIKATGQLSAHDQQALKNIADISGDMDKITKELSRITKMNIADVEKIYAQVVNDGVNTYKPLYDLKGMEFIPITQNDHAMKLIRNWATITAEKMINLSNTKAIGFTDANNNFTDIQGVFQRTIDDAVVAVSNGTSDFNSAMKHTIEQLGGSGVVTNYGSGVTRSLEAMVRQNLLWGAKQAAQSYDDYIADELGCDGFEVDAHSGCRPSHEFMQGKMFSYNGDKVVDGVLYQDGTEALKRLEDYNCLHFKTGVILGVSQPTYSQEDLDRIHRETTEKIEYNGKEKTLYEWKQTQRRFEREYRKAQTQSDMFKESGNNIKAKDFKDRAGAFKNAYDEMTAKVPGLYDHSERMQTFFKGTNPLTSGNNGGIIDVEIDELTPCVRRLKDNKIVETEIQQITPKKGEFTDWEFDWTLPEKTGHSVYALKAKGDSRVQGLISIKDEARSSACHIDIVESAPFNNPHNKNFVEKEYAGVGGHLFAEAIRQSFKNGYGGVIYFTAKSNLIEYYTKELGAVLVNPKLRIMVIEGEHSLKLYERYYGGKT